LAAEEQANPHAQLERVLAFALLRNGEWARAVTAAEKAVSLGDLASFPLLLAGIAEANLGEVQKAQTLLEEADTQWPKVLVEQGYNVTAEEGMLWFDKQSSLLELKTELEVLLYGK
jgi:hypothetical protein